VSKVPVGDQSGDALSTGPLISADGDVVVFVSQATDLVSGGSSGSQVFRHRLSTRATELLSATPSGTAGNSGCAEVVMAADADVVAFVCSASDLVAGDTNGTNDVFVWREGQPLGIASRGVGGAAANRAASQPAIAPDGSVVAFVSPATNMGVVNPDGIAQVYRHVVGTSADASLVSVARGGIVGGDNESSVPVVADGVIFFSSLADTLDFRPRLVGRATYERRADRSTCELVVSRSISATPAGGSEAGGPGSISADGRFVVFTSLAPDLVDNDFNDTDDVFRLDRETGELRLISVAADGTGSANRRSHSPVISADGQTVAFVSLATDLVVGVTDGNSDDVFVRDVDAGTTRLVSRHRLGTSAAGGQSPSLDASGTRVAWVTRTSAAEIDSAFVDTNGQDDVLVTDLGSGTIQLASAVAGSTTITGNGPSQRPSLSGDAGLVAFVSNATTLVDGVTDTNNAPDVFVHRLVGERLTSLVSRAHNSSSTANLGSTAPVIAADGSAVIFTSPASNLSILNVGVGTTHAWYRDLTTGAILPVDVDALGAPSRRGVSGTPAVTENGAVVAFISNSDDLVSAPQGGQSLAYLRDMGGTATVVLSPVVPGDFAPAVNAVALSGDGRVAAYSSSGARHIDGDRNDASDAVIVELNSAPTAGPLAVSTPINQAVTFDVPGADLDGDSLTVRILTEPAVTLTVLDGLTVRYEPPAGFFGETSFSYDLSDGIATSAFAVVTLTVVRNNTAPVANAGAASTRTNLPLTGQLFGTDADGDSLVFFPEVAPVQGAVSINPGTGVFEYVPNGTFIGEDRFSFVVDDGFARSAPAEVVITIALANRAPVISAPAEAQIFAGRVGVPLAIEVVASDEDGDPLTLRLASSRPGMVFDGTTLRWTPTALDVGLFDVGLIADDGELSTIRSVSVNVGANTPPRPRSRSGCASTDAVDASLVLLLLPLLRRRRRRRGRC
jgi:Tol biopolymer transport system component